MTRDETRNEKILNCILNVIPYDKKMVLIDVYDNETGELLESQIPIFKKDYDKDKGIIKLALEPFLRVSMHKELEKKYYNNFTPTERGYLFDLLRNIDSLGRIKYGKNYQQYCRKFEDISKVLNVSYNTIKQTLIPKMKKYDIIRIVTIEKGYEYTNDKYIGFNPILAINGVTWDRWTVIVWKDVIEEFNILTDSQIKRILGGK